MAASEFPFFEELTEARGLFKREWVRYLGPIFVMTLVQKGLALIPAVGPALAVFVGWPVSWIFYVGFYRWYRAEHETIGFSESSIHSAGSNLEESSAPNQSAAFGSGTNPMRATRMTVGTLLDELGDEWRTILAAYVARWLRIFAAGFWMIYPSLEKAGELAFVPQSLAVDRERHWNANEASEMVAGRHGWDVVTAYSALVLIGWIVKGLVTALLPTYLAVVVALIIDACLSLFLALVFIRIWDRRDQARAGIPLAANHRWDAAEYWQEIKLLAPRAAGTIVVLVVALGLIGFSGVETLIHFVK